MSFKHGYEEFDGRKSPQYWRRFCRGPEMIDVAVTTFGPSWGFTIWIDGSCEAGEKNYDWTRDDAIDRSEAKVRDLFGDG